MRCRLLPAPRRLPTGLVPVEARFDDYDLETNVPAAEKTSLHQVGGWRAFRSTDAMHPPWQ
jgi:hypothetical protein